MDELDPKSQVSFTAATSFGVTVAALASLLLADTTGLTTLSRVAAAGMALGLVLGILGLIDIKRSDRRLRGAGRATFIFWVTGFFLVCSLVYPLVVSQNCSNWGRSRRVQSRNNFKQIALALDNYRDAHGRFPPAFVSDASGRPLYSWRVLILPHLEETLLYSRFHLNEPWDSPHNRALLPLMPPPYWLPHRSSEEQPQGTTLVQVFVGKGTAFESPRGEPVTLPDGAPNFPDGLADTLLAVEARTAMPWTQPTFLPFLADAPLPALGGGAAPPGFWCASPPYGFLAVTGDTHAHTYDRPIEEPTLRALVTRNGREPINVRED